MAVVKINAIEIPEGAGQELESRFEQRIGYLKDQAGFLGFELLRPISGGTRYFVYSKWETEEDFKAWADGPARKAHSGDRQPVATGSELLEFEVALES